MQEYSTAFIAFKYNHSTTRTTLNKNKTLLKKCNFFKYRIKTGGGFLPHNAINNNIYYHNTFLNCVANVQCHME